jgi:transcriptional regulator with XRE-family HTH domain
LRRERGWTLETLAERSGVSRAMISKLERGEKNPRLVVAAKVAEGLGVRLSQLVGVEEKREVVVVPRERRMEMRDPETGFKRQLLSPSFGGSGVEFIRNVAPEGSSSREYCDYYTRLQVPRCAQRRVHPPRRGGESLKKIIPQD